MSPDSEVEKCASFLEIRNCWSFKWLKWCFLKKQGNKPGVILPLFRGFEVSLLPGCRCSRSTNGSTTPDQPCIGGGLGLWPTHCLISGEFGVISVRNFPRQFPPFPLGCLKTQKRPPQLCQSLERGMFCFFFRAVNLPAAVVPKKGNSLKQQKPCHHGTNHSHEIGSNDQFFQLFLQWAWLKQGHEWQLANFAPKNTGDVSIFYRRRETPPQSESATPPEARKKGVYGKSRVTVQICLILLLMVQKSGYHQLIW